MTGLFEAGGWGLLAGSALLIGAAAGYLFAVPQRVVAAVMAFGAGVLLSAVSFELIDDAYERGGLAATAAGAALGAVLYTAANLVLARRGARHRKRSTDQQPSEEGFAGSGLAIAFGALLDGVPESLVIGLTLLSGGAVSTVTVAAVFVSNIPEGLSSSSGMRRAGRGPRYVFGVWGSIAAVTGVSAMLGYGAFGGMPTSITAATTALAAGAMLTMITDTMIPEAFERAHLLTGVVAVGGFLVASALSHTV